MSLAWRTAEPGKALVLPGKPHGRVLPRSLPLWMAAVYVGLFIIRPWEQLFPELQAIQFERTYGICMVLCVAVTVGFRFELTLQTASALAFTGALGVCSLCAQNLDLAWEAFYTFLTLVICYFVLVSVIRTPYELLFIVGSYIGFMGLYLAKALWEFFVNGQHYYDQGVVRLGGIESTFGHYNKLAASIVVSLPFWLFLWQCRAEISTRWPERWRKWLTRGLAIYLALAIVSVVLTNSRSGMVALVVFVILSSLRKGSLARILRNVVVALLLVGVGWLVLPEEHKNRVRTIWDPEAGPANAEASKQGRVQGFLAGVEMFRGFPLAGVVPCNFAQYRGLHVDGLAMNAHNLFSQVLGETGLVGASTFLLMVACILLNGRRMNSFARGRLNPALHVLSRLARASRDSIILLLVEGVGGHNLYRYNWLWLAAFSLLGAQFAVVIRTQEDASCESVLDATEAGCSTLHMVGTP